MHNRSCGNAFSNGTRFHFIEGVGAVLHLGNLSREHVLMQPMVVDQKVHAPPSTEGKLPTAVKVGGTYPTRGFPLGSRYRVMHAGANCQGAYTPIIIFNVRLPS